jgi:hypothetical protein
MKRRLAIVLGMLACAVVGVITLGFVMESGLAALPKGIAWLGLFVSGAACLLLFIIGLLRNTRDARATQQARGSATDPASFPIAPDPSFARDAAELLRTPADARDLAWESRFYGTVAAAALRPGDPAQFTGPDGMPYAAFHLDDDNAAGRFSLTTVAEELTARGIGAALNPRADGTADWLFTCGDLLSLRMFGRIIPEPNSGRSEATADREVLVGSPSEALLPASARDVIRTFMRDQLGIAYPAVFLLSDAAIQPPDSLVFNVNGQQLREGWTPEGALRYLTWFLPRHYRIIGVPADSSLAQHFQPL